MVERKEIFAKKRERRGKVVQPPREVVECLVVMKVVVGETVAGVVAEGAEKEKAENDEKQGRKADFLSNLHSIFFLLRT